MSCFTFLLRTAQQRSKSLSLYARTVGTDSYKPPTHTIHSFAYCFLIAYIIYRNIFLFFYLAVKSLLIQYRLNCVLNDPASTWVNYNLRATLFFFFSCLVPGKSLTCAFPPDRSWRWLVRYESLQRIFGFKRCQSWTVHKVYKRKLYYLQVIF